MATTSPSRPMAPEVRIPAPTADRPVWSKVGIVAAAGFVLGIAWPRLVGVQVGPSVPGDYKPAGEATAAPGAAPSATANAAAAPSPGPSASADAAPAVRKQTVVVGGGTIAKCSDKKGKKLDDCGKLQFDPVAVPKLKELDGCPSALGLDGKMSIGFDIDFEKKEVHVVKGKKTTVPSSTVQGILQCAAREFASVALEEVPHQHRRYTVLYPLTFFPPGKQPQAPEEAGEAKPEGDGNDEAAGSTTAESDASGSATIAWDTALLRKEPKDGDVVARIVRGTRVKIVGKQNDWYKIEHNGKTGWVYRGAIGL